MNFEDVFEEHEAQKSKMQCFFFFWKNTFKYKVFNHTENITPESTMSHEH